MDPSNPLVKALRGLTIAVASLCALQFIQLCFYGWSYVTSMRMMSQTSSAKETLVSSRTTRSTAAEPTPEPSYSHLPPEQLVARASVIMLVTYIPDGKRFKAVVAEFVKRDPYGTLYYSVGDEFKAGETCGEGQVVFLVGSPAEMRVSYSFSNGRISGLGDMPLTQLRELSRGQEATNSKP